MKNLSLLALLATVALLGGCSFTDSQCGCVKANCCSWDWYQPCDLIEGRVDGQCPRICGEPPCCNGIVATRYVDMPAQDAPPPAAETEAEAAADALPEAEVVESDGK